MEAKEKAEWFRSVEVAANNLEANTSNADSIQELAKFTKIAAWINEELSVLAIVGGGPREPEFDDWIQTTIQDLCLLIPWVRKIYEGRKNQWFDLNNVLKHGYCHARTWHEIVLRNAEEFTEGARLINARNACRLLHDSLYESGKIRIHLELEFEHAEMELKALGGAKSNPAWTTDEETEARRLVTAGKVTTATALRDMLSMRQANSQALFRHITGKQKKKHRTD